MLRRRTLFATPFVVVLGCSHPADHTSSPQTKRDDAAQAQGDASDHVDVKDPGPNETGSGTAACPPGRQCNPPAPAHQKVIVDGVASQAQAGAEGLFFKARLTGEGSVTRDFTGVFLDDNGPIANTDFIVKNVNGALLLCVIKGRDALPSTHVRLYEPGAR